MFGLSKDKIKIINDDLINENISVDLTFVGEITKKTVKSGNIEIDYYIYKLYIHNDFKDSEKELFKLALYTYEPQLLIGLFKYFRNTVKFLNNNYNTIPLINADKKHLSRKNLLPNIVDNVLLKLKPFITKDDPVGTEKIIIQNKGKEFTQEIIAELLIIMSEIEINDKDKKEILLKHSQKFSKNKKVNNIIDFSQYALPFLIKFTSNEINFLNTFYASRIDNMDINNVKLHYKLYALHSDYNKNDLDYNIRIKDYVAPENIEVSRTENFVAPDNTEFITDIENSSIDALISYGRYIKNKKLIEKLNNLTIDEYNQIYSIINFYDNTNIVIKIIDYALSLDETNYNNTTEQSKIDNVYNIFEKYLTENIAEYEDMENIYILNTENNDKFMNKTLVRYQNNVVYSSVFTTIVECFDHMDNYDTNKIGFCKDLITYPCAIRFLTNANSCIHFLLLEKLLKLTNGNNIIELLIEVDSYDKPLSIKQWDKYIDSYDEYKDMPVSWWIELV